VHHELSEGRVICADNARVLPELPDASIDLIYIDPPFNTGRTQSQRAGKFVDSWDTVSDYVEFLRPRIMEMHRILRPTGSLLLHGDWRTSHRVRVMLDEVFGPDRFVNHLVWSYGLGGSSPRRFARKHDDILFYARTDRYYFAAPRVPATSQRLKGKSKKATDVLDIPSINNMARERAGYPTQKPLALLEMLIAACCPRGGLVADFFCGSGTALLAAKRLERRYLGVDCSRAAVSLARRRLLTNR